jgi:hypothetical protein
MKKKTTDTKRSGVSRRAKARRSVSEVNSIYMGGEKDRQSSVMPKFYERFFKKRIMMIILLLIVLLIFLLEIKL